MPYVIQRCVNCEVGRVSSPLGLCRGCWTNPQVRAMFGDPAVFSGPAKPCEPTDAKPGTPEKARVLEERHARNEQLWHPDDATWAVKPGEWLAALGELMTEPATEDDGE